jgi:hypothetical protein
LDYNKIKEEIKRKNFNEKFFIPENSDLSVQGFNKALKNDTLKVKDLISISKGLSLPVSHWFKEEDQFMISEAKVTYGDNPAMIIKELRALMEDCLDDKRRMKQEIDELKEKLGFSKVGS